MTNNVGQAILPAAAFQTALGRADTTYSPSVSAGGSVSCAND
jgi:hypothetical protein